MVVNAKNRIRFICRVKTKNKAERWAKENAKFKRQDVNLKKVNSLVRPQCSNQLLYSLLIRTLADQYISKWLIGSLSHWPIPQLYLRRMNLEFNKNEDAMKLSVSAMRQRHAQVS